MPTSYPVYTVTLNPGLDRTLTVPTIEYNKVLRATESRLDWGGKGFNVSRGLTAMGVDSLAMGFVGGAIGAMLEDGLRSMGVATEFVQIAGETRTNTVVEETGSHRYLKVNEIGPAIESDAVDELFSLIDGHVVSGSIWVLSGSLPPGVPADTYALLIKRIQQNGGRCFLDTSGEALERGCEAGPYLVKPNAEEAQAVTGLHIETVQDATITAALFREMGAELVALSMAEDGMLLASADICVQARPPSVDVRTVVGVGDALVAGLVYATVKEMDLAETAAWGVAAGTSAAMGAGVCVGSLEEVRAMVERVTVAAIE